MNIGYKEVYDIYCRLVIHSESISWQRFYNLLVINSILILAWATLFKGDATPSKIAKLVMTGIPFIGILTTLAWAGLGDRGRKYLDAYKEKAKRIEQDCDKQKWWKDDIEITDRPFQIHIQPAPGTSSNFLLGKGPYFFTLLYVGLIIATWLHNPLLPNK